jgi:8-oxo-dGTP diphosphatase
MKTDNISTYPDWLPQKNYLPNLSVDCVIFGYHEKQLKILCTRPAGSNGWLLPGGYIGINENLEDAANRILAERTGVAGLYIKQFKTYGNINRSWNHPDNSGNMITYPGLMPEEEKWMMERFVTVGYYALTEFSKVRMESTLIEGECSWFDIYELPTLLLDHDILVRDALKILQLQIHYEPIGYNLLPAKFTLPEMLALYETILDKKIDHRNFNKKLVSLEVIKKLNQKKHIGGHRAPTLYRFNKRNYDKALKDEMRLIF